MHLYTDAETYSSHACVAKTGYDPVIIIIIIVAESSPKKDKQHSS